MLLLTPNTKQVTAIKRSRSLQFFAMEWGQFPAPFLHCLQFPPHAKLSVIIIKVCPLLPSWWICSRAACELASFKLVFHYSIMPQNAYLLSVSIRLFWSFVCLSCQQHIPWQRCVFVFLRQHVHLHLLSLISKDSVAKTAFFFTCSHTVTLLDLAANLLEPALGQHGCVVGLCHVCMFCMSMSPEIMGEMRQRWGKMIQNCHLHVDLA